MPIQRVLQVVFAVVAAVLAAMFMLLEQMQRVQGDSEPGPEDTGVARSRSEPGQGLFPLMAIRDSQGAGIRPQDQPRLFRAFEQVGAVKPREGTGLGLYVSGKLAALIGARVEFASEFGKGSRFTVLIPRA